MNCVHPEYDTCGLLLRHATAWFWNVVPVSISGHAPEMRRGFGGGNPHLEEHQQRLPSQETDIDGLRRNKG